jgi:hypothetical protein
MVEQNSDAREDIILRLVRSDLPLSAAAWAGVVIEKTAVKGWTLTVSSPLVVLPSVRDVATGLARNLSKEGHLREWATFLLGASNVLSLQRLEAEDAGDALVGAVWDAAFVGTLRPDQVAMVNRLVERG